MPYLLYSSYGRGLGINFLSVGNLIGNDTVSVGAGIVFLILIAVLLFLQGKKKISYNRPMLMALGICGFGLVCEFLYRFTHFDLQHGFPIHLYRFQYFVLFFLGAAITDRISRKIEFISILVAFILVTPVCAFFCVDSVTTDYNLGFRFPPDSRVLVYQGASSLLTTVAPHQLSDSMQLEGIQTLNGLFAESSKHSRFYMGLENELFSRPMVWGVEPMTYSPRLAIKHLSALGVSGIVSREPLNQAIKNQLHFTNMSENISVEAIHGGEMSYELFSAYLLHSPLAEWIKKTRFVDSNWNSEVYDWWMEEKPVDEILIRAPSLFVQKKNGNIGAITASSVEKGQFSIDTHTQNPGWVLVKESYFPNWKASDHDGKEIAVYEASPHMMSVWGAGQISFHFTLSKIELIAQWCTLLSLLLVGVIFLPRTVAVFSVLFLMQTAHAEIFDTLRSNHLIVGDYHICNIYEHAVTCWGINHDGQLGTGNHISATKARIVIPIPENLQSGIAGHSFSCFYSEKEVWCSGRIGSFTSLTQVPFFKSELAIDHLVSSAIGFCILFKDRLSRPKCFGKNEYSELGSFHFPEKTTEVQLGAAHVCAIVNSELWCAGSNDRGQLGDGTVTNRNDFAPVKFTKRKKDFSVLHFTIGADHTCVILSNGRDNELYCFGDNRFGQLGSPIENMSFPTPKKIELPLSEIPIGVALGDSHTCVNTDGHLYCFGDNSKKQVNPLSKDAKKSIITTPTAVPLVSKAQEVYAKGLSTCIVKGDHYSCWGLVGNGL